MTPDRDYNIWTYGIAALGGMVTNIDTGMRTLLLCAAAALIAVLLGFGYNSMMTSLHDLKVGQMALHAETCTTYDKLDNRMREVEKGQVEVKTLVQTHLHGGDDKKK